MLRGIALMGLTLLSAGGIAGEIQSGMPRSAVVAPALRLQVLERHLVLGDNQRAAWSGFEQAALTMARLEPVSPPGPSGGLVGTLAARSMAATRLRDAAMRLDAVLTDHQRRTVDADWAASGF